MISLQIQASRRMVAWAVFMMLTVFFVQSVEAIERRRDQFGKEFGYFIYPIASEIPGLGTAAGAGATALNMFDTDADFTGFYLRGDFNVSGYTLLDMHLLPETLVFDIGTFTVDVAPLVYRRGMNSKPDDYIQPHVKGSYRLAQLTFTAKERLFEAYYRYMDGSASINEILDKDGNRFENIDQQAYELKMPTIGWILDYTDDRLDPRLGARYEWAKKMPENTDPTASEYSVVDQNFSFYVPFRQWDTLVFNAFKSDATITRQGPTDFAELQASSGLNCSALPPEAQEPCLAAEKESLEQTIAGNTYGTAGSLGGTQRLRAYPGGRFYAGHSLFYGLEYRLNLQDVREKFDILIARGVRTGFQLAFFAERGGVADDPAEIADNMRNSFGVGGRVLFTGVIVRLDWATGDEGSQVQLFINYPFGMFSVDNPG